MRRWFCILSALAVLACAACSDDTDNSACTPGEEGCVCNGGVCLTGLTCRSNVCINPDKKANGADCASDAECQSGRCEETTVEGMTVKKCAASSAKPDGGTPSGSCVIDGRTVKNLHFECDGKKLYECDNGTPKLRKDCSSCYYTGSGTGSKYKTRCKDYLSSEIPSAWGSEQKKKYKGPGCYYGFSVICGPYL